MVTVIENFVPKQYQDFLENKLRSENFPLYVSNYTVYPDSVEKNLLTEKSKDTPQFTHVFFEGGVIKSNYWDVVSPIVFKFLESNQDYDIFRAKLNLNVQNNTFNESEHCTPHTDIEPYLKKDKQYITAIYYVVDSDGDTMFFDKNKNINQRCTPKKGNFIYFDSNTVHAGQPPKQFLFRCLINFNFIKKS